MSFLINRTTPNSPASTDAGVGTRKRTGNDRGDREAPVARTERSRATAEGLARVPTIRNPPDGLEDAVGNA